MRKPFAITLMSTTFAVGATYADTTDRPGEAKGKKAETKDPDTTPKKGFVGAFTDVMKAAREARCKTAICWGEDNTYALEPLAEIPIGKSFALPTSSLATYVNNHDVSAQFTAGVRFWLAKDFFSVGIYLSKPLLQEKTSIRVNGSPYEHPASNVRRPLPGIAFGFFGDTIWLGVDFDQLRNGDSESQRDLMYPRNAAISDTVTFTLAFSPIALIRNGLGASHGDKKDETPKTTSELEQTGTAAPLAQPAREVPSVPATPPSVRKPDSAPSTAPSEE